MDNVELPAVPVAVVLIAGLITPYLVAVVNNPRWSGTAKRVSAVVGSVVVSVLSLVGSYVWTGDPVPDIVPLILLGLIVSQSTYALVTKGSAKKLESVTSKPFL